jgi:hypothetical protein
MTFSYSSDVSVETGGAAHPLAPLVRAASICMPVSSAVRSCRHNVVHGIDLWRPRRTDLLRLSSVGCAPARSTLHRAEPAETHIRLDDPNDAVLIALACSRVTIRRSDRSCGVFVQRNSAPIW